MEDILAWIVVALVALAIAWALVSVFTPAVL